MLTEQYGQENKHVPHHVLHQHSSAEKRIMYHFRESLWNEIFVRYMGQKTLERQVLEQLDNDMIEPEDIKL